MKSMVLAAAFCAALTGAAWTLDIEAASGRFGVAVINNQAGLDSTLSPVVNTLGGSMVVGFSEGFFLTVEPGLDLYWTNYEWDTDRAVPTVVETGGGNNAFILGFIVDLPVTATLRFNERLGGAASLGPAFVLRAPFANDQTAGYEDEMAENLANIASYLWGRGRWLNLSAALRFDVYLQQNFTFALGVRGFLPIYNAWTGNAKFLDEGILHITMSMIVGIE